MCFRDILLSVFAFPSLLGFVVSSALAADGESRFARADSLSGYVHWIELLDDQFNRIDPNSDMPRPYSPAKTCGRCHDYNTISHAWHFDAVERGEPGRPGQPWIWKDPRTGTYLPLSYRGWKGTFDPDRLGITRWAVAKQFGGYLPGGGPGSPESLKENAKADTGTADEKASTSVQSPDRSDVTGPLPIDCMLCHRNDRSYSPETWTKQIDVENFAYAPTVAAGLATIEGSMERVRSKSDPAAANDSEPLPMLKYDASRFRSDGKIFFDITRKPSNNACYYCHSNLSTEALGSSRWTHDDDVHIRAGMACADCHRNGLDHQTVRGFEGEVHPQPNSIASLSCRGCHIGSQSATSHSISHSTSHSMAGRFGAPLPAHRGLPPLHFEKMSCTACHSGPIPESEPMRVVNSIAHQLGISAHRSADELPGIVAPVMLAVEKYSATSSDGGESATPQGQRAAKENSDPNASIYTPHRMTWPAYWGIMKEKVIEPLEPETAFQTTRKALKIRKSFSEELIAVKPSLSDRKSILGDDRAKAKDADLTDEERTKIEAWTIKQGQKQLRTKLADAMTAIEQANPGTKGVYIAGGMGYRKRTGDSDDPIEPIPAEELGDAATAYAWPMAHDVRPARWSLGVNGCIECHSRDAAFFSSQVTAVGTLPGFETASVPIHQLQHVDIDRITQWNTLFEGRSAFKFFAFACLGLLALMIFGSLAWGVGRRVSRVGAS